MRLTHKRANGYGYWSQANKQELINRLAEYENIGEPEKIKNICPSIMPLGDDELLYGECPSCKSVVLKSGKTAQRYCPWCGQAIDWRE